MNLRRQKMKVRQYEIWVADLNPRIGTEPGKIRPVVVIQTDLLNKHHPSTIVCPLTTNVEPGSTILRVPLAKGSCELEEECDMMIDQVRAIDNKRLVRWLGKIPVEAVDRIKISLKVIFDLD
jgi:mRNA interferase MazF